MGRPTYDHTGGEPTRGYMTRLYLVDGDYDRGGAYWGAPSNIYWLRDREGAFQAFTRADSRGAAATQFMEDFPHVKIFGFYEGQSLMVFECPLCGRWFKTRSLKAFTKTMGKHRATAHPLHQGPINYKRIK